MKKVWKKMKDLLISITFSKPKEFDRLSKKSEKNKKLVSKKKSRQTEKIYLINSTLERTSLSSSLIV